jgi:hypothetical protein
MSTPTNPPLAYAFASPLAFIEIPDPEVVYHYTSVDTLLKIVDSRQIRATSVGFLNDTKERDLFLEAVDKHLPKFLQAHPEIDPTFFDSFMEFRATQEPTSFLPFTASFCREEDSLPQWRAYCAGGNGVSIGFRVACLKTAVVGVDDSCVNDNERPVTGVPIFGEVKYLGEFQRVKSTWSYNLRRRRV